MEMNPTVWLPPTTPLTCHVTAVVGEPFKDAVNCCVPKSGTVTAFGDTLTEPAGLTAVTVTVADADFVLSACDVAVTVTCAGFGTAVGAMYIPVLVIFPLEAPPAPLHVASGFEMPGLDAVNGCVFPNAPVPLAGGFINPLLDSRLVGGDAERP